MWNYIDLSKDERYLLDFMVEDFYWLQDFCSERRTAESAVRGLLDKGLIKLYRIPEGQDLPGGEEPVPPALSLAETDYALQDRLWEPTQGTDRASIALTSTEEGDRTYYSTDVSSLDKNWPKGSSVGYEFFDCRSTIKIIGKISGIPFLCKVEWKKQWQGWTFTVACGIEAEPEKIDSTEKGFYLTSGGTWFESRNYFMRKDVLESIAVECIHKYFECRQSL
jgi:hypothetical protein